MHYYHMQFDLCTPLTLKFMGLGRSFHEAERITGFIVTSVVMVLTLMGYRICNTRDADQADEQINRPCTIPGIHPGFSGSKSCGFGHIVVDARGAVRSFSYMPYGALV